MLDPTSTEPIYQQIANWLEREMLEKRLQAHDKIYSQYQLADMFQVNPATAGKAITLLVEKNLAYKKRGLGTFVQEQAFDTLKTERLSSTLDEAVQTVVKEAQLLNITEEMLIRKIKDAFHQGGKSS